jgi:hypothetical protein
MQSYLVELRKLQGYHPPVHNCLNKKKSKKPKFNNQNYLVEMELRAKDEPKEFLDKDLSAHQFS